VELLRGAAQAACLRDEVEHVQVAQPQEGDFRLGQVFLHVLDELITCSNHIIGLKVMACLQSSATP
jgi:hypothetical protein